MVTCAGFRMTSAPRIRTPSRTGMAKPAALLRERRKRSHVQASKSARADMGTNAHTCARLSRQMLKAGHLRSHLSNHRDREVILTGLRKINHDGVRSAKWRNLLPTRTSMKLCAFRALPPTCKREDLSVLDKPKFSHVPRTLTLGRSPTDRMTSRTRTVLKSNLCVRNAKAEERI